MVLTMRPNFIRVGLEEVVAYLRPGLPGGLGLGGHGALQLNGQSDVLAAEGEDG